MTNVYFHVRNMADNFQGIAVGEAWQAHARAQFEKIAFTVPFGKGVTPRSISLRAGQYWVELRLPSGDILKELITVNGTGNQTVTLMNTEHEVIDQSTKKFTFNYEPAPIASSRQIKRGASTGNSPNRRMTFDYAFGSPSAGRLQSTGHVIGSTLRSPGYQVVSQRSERPPIDFSLHCLTGRFDSWVEYVSRRLYTESMQIVKKSPSWYFDRLFRYGKSIPIGVDPRGSSSLTVDLRDPIFAQEIVPDRSDGNLSQSRRFIVLDSDSERTKLLICVPGRLRYHESCNLRIAGDDNNEKFPLHLSLTFDDSESDSLLQFLRSGDEVAAMTLVRTSEAVLWGKFENPVAAAAAGYVLIQAPAEYMRVPWHQWIGNLGYYFPDLPDGLILHATLLLQRSDLEHWPRYDRETFHRYYPRNSDDRHEEAASLIVKAIRRGPPMYRMGLKLLAANLQILRGVKIKRTSRDLLAHIESLVTWLSMRVDPIEPNCIFRLEQGRA